MCTCHLEISTIINKFYYLDYRQSERKTNLYRVARLLEASVISMSLELVVPHQLSLSANLVYFPSVRTPATALHGWIPLGVSLTLAARVRTIVTTSQSRTFCGAPRYQLVLPRVSSVMESRTHIHGDRHV
jgi:hypothetical protein